MAGSTLEKLKASAAAAHTDLLWGFILRVMELRQKQPPSIPVFQAVEEAAVQLLVKLTLKLSEAQFKPRFLRLLDWAAAIPLTGANHLSYYLKNYSCHAAASWRSGDLPAGILER